MRTIESHCILATAICLAMRASPALADEDEIHVGHNAASQLKAHVEFAQPLALEASVFPGISGYATGLLGMHSTELDEPAEDFFQLSTAADLRFILVAKDAGMEVWNDHGSGFLQIGETFFIGEPPFDTHPIWNLLTNTPGITYSLTIKLHDLNGIYSDSDPVGLSFTALIFRPQINIAPTDALHATLSWTTNAVGWTLESATSVIATNWSSVTNVPIITGTNFSLNLGTDGASKFFRLRLQ